MQHGTLLQMISRHSLYIECRACGHASTLPVADCIAHLGHGAAVKDVLARVKCSKCSSKQIGQVRITSPDVITRQENAQAGIETS